MSLLDSIRQKKKNLTHCATVVTKLSGEKYTEAVDDSGNLQQWKISESRAGFIEDLTPDLQLADILPFLALGSQDAAVHYSTLKNGGISHVLSIGVRIFQTFECISYTFIDLYDLPDAELLAVLPQATDVINSARDSGGKVLVHCNAGCSRAPSVVIGYLMSLNGWTYREAFLFVGDKRYVRPNDGFIRQLLQLQT